FADTCECSGQDASFSRRVSGLSVRNSNPPALAGGCLVVIPAKAGIQTLGLTGFPLSRERQKSNKSAFPKAKEA
ncbi:MAG: hypothetical protein OEV23_07655, partial [Gallionella sp.]|nr:hypothetical protein [Gallionella sp.]